VRVITCTSWLSRNEKGDLSQSKQMADYQKQALEQQLPEEEWKVHVLRAGSEFEDMLTLLLDLAHMHAIS